MVEFVSVDCSLEPSMEILGPVGFQIDSVEERWVERVFKLFSELDVGGVVLLGVRFNGKTCFLSTYFELVDELVGSRVSLTQGVQSLKGDSREVGGLVGVAEFFPEVLVTSEIGESIRVGVSSCDPSFGPEGGAVDEVGDDKQDSFLVGFDGFRMESQIDGDFEKEILELGSISAESRGFITQFFGGGVGDSFVDGGSFGRRHSGWFGRW
jgi:hypothetical protein